MSLSVVTIDFWNTLYDAGNGPPRRAARMDAFLNAVRAAGHQCDEGRYEAVQTQLWEYFDHHWLERQRTPTSREMVCHMLQRLEFTLEQAAIEQVTSVFEAGVLDHPPSLLPGVHDALRLLNERNIRLALISDTAFSPGTVLRQLMERDGIARYFDAFVFSDETGVAKPHAEAFRRALEPLNGTPAGALHIGDIERTDIRGAKGIGMGAVLYRGGAHDAKYAESQTAADMVMDHWGEIEAVLDAAVAED